MQRGDRPAAKGDCPVFDAQTLLTHLGGDRNLAKTIIESATGDLLGYFDRLEQAIDAGNWAAARRLTHTMKGLTAQIGGIRLSSSLKEIDDRLRDGGRTDMPTVDALRSEYQVLSAILQEWMR